MGSSTDSRYYLQSQGVLGREGRYKGKPVTVRAAWLSVNVDVTEKKWDSTMDLHSREKESSRRERAFPMLTLEDDEGRMFSCKIDDENLFLSPASGDPFRR